MHGNAYDDDEDGDGGENVGLVFGGGIFLRSETAVHEGTNEVMSFLMPAFDIAVQAFLVDDFDMGHPLGAEIIPNVQDGVSFIRIDRHLWEFIEDIASCEHEAPFLQGLVLGELLVGTAHRMVAAKTGSLPPF